MCAGHKDRFYPVGHVSLRNPAEAANELRRLAKAGIRAVFIAAMPVSGKSLGNPEFDPVWAAAQEADIAVGLHLVVHRAYIGNEWHRDSDPGFMF